MNRHSRRRDRIYRRVGNTVRGRRGGDRGSAVILARALLPRGTLLARGMAAGIGASILCENFHRTGNTPPAAPVDRYERAGAHNAARADRARRDARALEWQYARGREERRRIYGKKAHVCAGHDISGTVADKGGGRSWLFGQGHARESRGRGCWTDTAMRVGGLYGHGLSDGDRDIIAHVGEGLAREVCGP